MRLDPDGTLTWTDPGGRRQITEPFNHLAAHLGTNAVRRAPAGGDGGSQDLPTSAAEETHEDSRDRFDPTTDRHDEVIAGLTGRAIHTWTALTGSPHDMHLVSFADCPVSWEFAGVWPETAIEPTINAGPTTGSTKIPPDSDDGRDEPNGPGSWGDGNYVEGDEPPF